MGFWYVALLLARLGSGLPMTSPLAIVANQLTGRVDQTRGADEDEARQILAALQTDGWRLIKVADMAVARRQFAFAEYQE